VDSEGGEIEDSKPIELTNARLDQYVAFRKEFNRHYAGWFKDVTNLGKSVDAKSTDITKAFTAATGAAAIGEKHAKELSALRSKHGFTEDEDERLWSAISDVVAAKVLDNPMMADSFKSFREMQAKGGEEKKMADELLKGMEDQEKEGLAEARKKYGDACVDLLSKRAKELGQLQTDLMKEITAQAEKK
jgi:hypothetical protein